MKPKLDKRIALATALATTLMLPLGAAARGPGGQEEIYFEQLRGLQPPLPDLTGIVVDRNAAIALGKALFWDIGAGSDGQACASCHFHAGADMRVKNQLNPGKDDGTTTAVFGDANGLMKSGAVAGPNYTLQPADFPLHVLADVNNRDSAILYDTHDVVGSAGTFGTKFKRVRPRAFSLLAPSTNPNLTTDVCSGNYTDPIFHTAYGNVRRVTGRNTPTNINAVFNFRSFWDGRANNVFNGVDPFGARNQGASIYVRSGTGGIAPQKLALVDASLASQAVGPPLSDVEMSCAGRIFADIGKKLLPQKPLATQAVAANDSVLGPLRQSTGKGLIDRYYELVTKAFAPKYWASLGLFTVDPSTGEVRRSLTGYAQAELNFSMFWGVSIMLYESTLISDQSPYDDYLATNDTSRFGQLEQDGMRVFQGKGMCVNCHRGPTQTAAALQIGASRLDLDMLDEQPEDKIIERMPLANQTLALYDTGFYNIGVTQAKDDAGLGGTDPWGNPLSFTRQFKANPATPGPDQFSVDPCDFEAPTGSLGCGADLSTTDLSGERVAVDGSFKVPTLRNIAQTAPYYHNGGYSTLDQVDEYNNRGGNRRNLDTPDDNPWDPMIARNDTTGTGPLGELIGPDGKRGSNLAPDIEPLGLNDYEKTALVAFLKSLTDDRVRCHAAPFDHPELPVAVGAVDADANGDGRADEVVRTLMATGAAGIPNCAVTNDGDLFSVSASLTSQAFR
jgi:cytochrome c peroxidase